MFHFLQKYRQGIFLSLLTAGSYILGYVRDKVFSHYYGLSSTLDIYHASFIIPDTVMNLFLAGAMVSVIVPVMNKFKENKDQNHLLSAVLEFSLLINIVICVVMFFLMPLLAPLVVHNKELVDPVVFYSRVLLISPLIFLVSNFFGGILVSKHNLVFYGLSPILYNLGIIGGVVILHDQGVLGIIIGALLGGLCHLSIRVIGVLKNKYIHLEFGQFINRWQDIRRNLGYFFKLALPKMISLTTLHFNYWIFTYFSSQSATEGSIFALNICRNFYNVPISVIAIALATDAFSVLSKEFGQQNVVDFRKSFARYLWLIVGSGIVFGIVYYFLAPLFITILLKGGKFNHDAVVFTGTLLSYFGFVIIFESMMQYFARVLHAMQDTFWQMVSQITCFVVTFIALNLSFGSLGIIAIPISFSMGMLAQNLVQGSVIAWKMKHSFVSELAV